MACAIFVYNFVASFSVLEAVIIVKEYKASCKTALRGILSMDFNRVSDRNTNTITISVLSL